MTNTTEAALSEIMRRTGLLIQQNTGRWDMRKEHDKRTLDVLMANQAIAESALSQPSPASSTAGEPDHIADTGEMGEPASVAVEEPTAKGDRVAGLMREYFEAHKRDKWDGGITADNLMIGLLNIALREYRAVEPASVAGEASEAMVEAGARVIANNPHMRSIPLAEAVYAAMTAAALSKPTPVEAGLRELTDKQILEIASNPICSPCSPWWLKDDVLLGDVQQAAIAFARAILAAQSQPAATVQEVGRLMRNRLRHFFDGCNHTSAASYEYRNGWKGAVAAADRAILDMINDGAALTAEPAAPPPVERGV